MDLPWARFSTWHATAGLETCPTFLSKWNPRRGIRGRRALDAAPHGELVDRRAVLEKGRNGNGECQGERLLRRASRRGWGRRDRPRRLGTIRTAARASGLEWPGFRALVNHWLRLMWLTVALPPGDMDVVATGSAGVARHQPHESHRGQRDGWLRSASETMWKPVWEHATILDAGS